jgi:hypothetical protein
MTERQDRAARLLSRALTQREVASLVERDERTIRTWLKTVPGFKQAAGCGRVLSVPLSPAAVLRELLHSDSESIRLRAAIALAHVPPEPEDPNPDVPIVYAPPLNPS